MRRRRPLTPTGHGRTDASDGSCRRPQSTPARQGVTLGLPRRPGPSRFDVAYRTAQTTAAGMSPLAHSAAMSAAVRIRSTRSIQRRKRQADATTASWILPTAAELPFVIAMPAHSLRVWAAACPRLVARWSQGSKKAAQTAALSQNN